jgi:hypothetical protein
VDCSSGCCVRCIGFMLLIKCNLCFLGGGASALCVGQFYLWVEWTAAKMPCPCVMKQHPCRSIVAAGSSICTTEVMLQMLCGSLSAASFSCWSQPVEVAGSFKQLPLQALLVCLSRVDMRVNPWAGSGQMVCYLGSLGSVAACVLTRTHHASPQLSTLHHETVPLINIHCRDIAVQRVS